MHHATAGWQWGNAKKEHLDANSVLVFLGVLFQPLHSFIAFTVLLLFFI